MTDKPTKEEILEWLDREIPEWEFAYRHQKSGEPNTLLMHTEEFDLEVLQAIRDIVNADPTYTLPDGTECCSSCGTALGIVSSGDGIDDDGNIVSKSDTENIVSDVACRKCYEALERQVADLKKEITSIREAVKEKGWKLIEVTGGPKLVFTFGSKKEE